MALSLNKKKSGKLSLAKPPTIPAMKQNVEKQNASLRSVLKGLGLPDPTLKDVVRPLERVLGVMDAPGTAVRASVHNIVDPKNAVQPLAEAGKALRGEERVEGSDILRDMGVKNKWGLMLGGIAVNMLTDPTTYLSFGMGGAGKSAVSATLDDLARGVVNLADVGVDAAKYADYLDDAGKLANIVDLPTEVGAALFDDVAKAIGVKGGVKFMGKTVVPVQDEMSAAARGVKSLLRGQKGPQAYKDVAGPLSTWFEQAFIHDELTPIYREGNEVLKAFTTGATRRRNAGLHLADQAAEAIDRKLRTLIPDEGTRILVSKGIGRQFGDTGNLSKLARAFDAVDSAADDVAHAEAVETLHRLRTEMFDADAITRTLKESGVSGDELVKAQEAAKLAQDHFEGLLRAKRDVGLPAKSLFGEGPGGESAGYVPGMDISRYKPKDQKAAEKMVDSVLGEADTVAPDSASGMFQRMMKPKPEKAKVYINPEMRRAGLTIDDLASGATESATPGLRTEFDIAELTGRATRKDMRNVAFQNYVDELKSVVGDSPEIETQLLKAKDFFTNDDATKGFLKTTDRALNTWRRWATIYNFPMFPARNWLSNKFLLATEGILEPDALGVALKIAANPKDAANLTVKVGERTLTGAELLEEAANLRVWVGSPESLQMVGKGLSNKLQEGLGDFNQRFIEDADRLSGYIAGLRKGLAPEAAAMTVDRALYSYAPEALTTFERNVMRRITPFYTFMRRNTPHMVELLATKPGMFTPLGHAQGVGYDVTGADKKLTPDYLRDLLAIPVPFGEDTAYVSTGGVIPVTDVQRVLPLSGPKEFMLEQLQSLNPFVRDLFIEFPLNYDIYREQPIEKFPGAVTKLPDYVQVFDDLAKSLPVVSDVWDQTKTHLNLRYKVTADGTKYLAGDPYATKAVKDFLPWMNSIGRVASKDKTALVTQLSGIKLAPYEPKEFAKQKGYDDRSKLQDIVTRLKDEGTVPKKKGRKPKKAKTLKIGGKSKGLLVKTTGPKGDAKFGLDPAFYSALKSANADMASQGLGTFGISSGRRSAAEQRALRKSGAPAAPVGQSEHQGRPGTVTVADISTPGEGNIDPKQLAWLLANGKRYGLAHPDPNEPWHWELEQADGPKGDEWYNTDPASLYPKPYDPLTLAYTPPAVDTYSPFFSGSQVSVPKLTLANVMAGMFQPLQTREQQVASDPLYQSMSADAAANGGSVPEASSFGGSAGGVSYDGYKAAEGSGRKVLDTALKYKGIPYQWGGEGPRYDCSGLTLTVAKDLGFEGMPHHSSDQYDYFAKQGYAVKPEDVAVGDFVYISPNGGHITHVGIYAGDGKIFNSPRTGTKIRFDNLGGRVIVGAVRLPVVSEGVVGKAVQNSTPEGAGAPPIESSNPLFSGPPPDDDPKRYAQLEPMWKAEAPEKNFSTWYAEKRSAIRAQDQQQLSTLAASISRPEREPAEPPTANASDLGNLTRAQVSALPPQDKYLAWRYGYKEPAEPSMRQAKDASDVLLGGAQYHLGTAAQFLAGKPMPKNLPAPNVPESAWRPITKPRMAVEPDYFEDSPTPQQFKQMPLAQQYGFAKAQGGEKFQQGLSLPEKVVQDIGMLGYAASTHNASPMREVQPVAGNNPFAGIKLNTQMPAPDPASLPMMWGLPVIDQDPGNLPPGEYRLSEFLHLGPGGPTITIPRPLSLNQMLGREPSQSRSLGKPSTQQQYRDYRAGERAVPKQKSVAQQTRDYRAGERAVPAKPKPKSPEQQYRDYRAGERSAGW